MTRLIPQNQLASQHGQVLDSHQAVADLRQALNYPYDLQGFDGLLSAVGANRSNYMQAANQQKLINAVSNGDWVMVKPESIPITAVLHGMPSSPNLSHHPHNIWSKNTPSPCLNRLSPASTSSSAP